MIVVMAPSREHLAGVGEAVEDLLIEAFVAQLSIDPKGGVANLSTNPFCWVSLPGAM